MERRELEAGWTVYMGWMQNTVNDLGEENNYRRVLGGALVFVTDLSPFLCLVLFSFLKFLSPLCPFPLTSFAFVILAYISASSFLIPFFFYTLFFFPRYPFSYFYPHRMLQPVPKQEGRTVVVVNSPRTPLGPVPVRPPPGPELSTQPTPGPTPPVLPAPLMVSASPVGPPLIPTSRPPGPVLLPPLQPNSGPLPQGELQGAKMLGDTSCRLLKLGKK